MVGRSSAELRLDTRNGTSYNTVSPKRIRKGHPAHELSFLHPVLTTHRPWRGKRVLDVVGAIGIAIVCLPVFVAVMLTLWLSGGGVFFRHTRIGRGGRRFECYKFRTMVPNAEKVLQELFEREPKLRAEWILDQKLRTDPRITRIGAWLRRTSLDELPQLWNVLKGDMSLVGPRPIVKDEIFRYGRALRYYLAVKPGLTGLWQVSGRNNTQYFRRVAMDRAYTRRSGLILDLWILIQTIYVVVGRRGAY